MAYPFEVDLALAEYIERMWSREPEVARRLREETAGLPEAEMQVSAGQGQFMAMLVRMLGARRTLEAGVFTGYSSLIVALALPGDGQVVACDVSEEWTSMGRRYWKEAGVAHKIDLRLGPAVDTWKGLLATGQAGTFDFAFIDADKTNYANYYELALELVRPGGMIAVDNVIWSGKVIDESVVDEDTRTIRAFNEKLSGDARVWLNLVPIRDGLTLALKK